MGISVRIEARCFFGNLKGAPKNEGVSSFDASPLQLGTSGCIIVDNIWHFYLPLF